MDELKKYKLILIPGLTIAGLIVVAAVILLITDPRTGWFVDDPLATLTDGTKPTDPDPNLKEIGNGIKYRDLKIGTGAEVAKGGVVEAHYTGWLTDGKRFDSSRPTEKPATFPLANVIKGWQDGLPGMKVGGIRKLVIPPDLAYGEKGSPGKIPPNATLIFEVELVSLQN